MNLKKSFRIYTGIWLVGTIFLSALLRQNIGDGRSPNNSGFSGGALAFCMGLYCVCIIASIIYFSVLIRRYQKEIEISLCFDKLTGVYNRRGFEEEAAALLRRNHTHNVVIVEFDIVNFKNINNTYGYAKGDRLLQSLAAAVMEWKGDNAVLGRINADDFVLLGSGAGSQTPDLPELLKQTVRQQKMFQLFGEVNFTYGAYRIENKNELIKTIMDKANTAHKTAKRDEQKSFIWYDETLIEKIQWENRYGELMQQGLEREEFRLYLQPKIELSSMKVMGAEALVRWEIPDRGLVYPDEFIPLFEKNGSITKLDYYMLEKSCACLRAQMDRGFPAVMISVNFSRVTLYDEGFCDTFIKIVDSYALPHGFIEVEITESAFNEITDTVLQSIQHLNDSGFLISMDDFGAGYSNLNLLSRLPIQIIKLDREFIREVDHNEKVRGIIACIVDIAHAMGLKVVCEGVELEQQIDFLRNTGCDYAQGYYFSEPVPQGEFS